ncbi:CoA transferase [Streptomyces sp. NPDC097610]|uniref:CoA transferase n=1 Tax=Streptomyces sp. NPDC097610 TaxID=3157227 RepID=UPI00332D58BE
MDMYRTADDRWIVLVLVFVNEDQQVPLFLKAISHPEAAENPRYADTPSRRARAAEIVTLLDRTFATRSLAEWREVLDAAGLTYGVVQTLKKCAQDPQFLANRVFVPIDDGSDDPHLTVDSPVRLDQEQKVRPGPPPTWANTPSPCSATSASTPPESRSCARPKQSAEAATRQRDGRRETPS